VPRPFTFDRTFPFDISVDDLWTVLCETSDYPFWWSWLRDLDAGRLESGSSASFRVKAPLPYSLHCTVLLDEVVERERINAKVGGDVRGPARLVVTATADGGSQARLTWSLELQRPMLVRLERIARPLMVWGHDLVVAMGIRQFRRKALSR
jgi:hypothetical protein